MPQPVRQPTGPGDFTDLTGKTVGRFTIRARLGAGGMGEVYRAYDTALKRPVALKRITPRLQYDENYRRRFLREAQCASGLTDQHIAGLYDVLEANNEIFLVMEYVEGVTLRQQLQHPISIEKFLGIAAQCAAALVTAHGHGIVHRDLKPENIMLTPAGQVKILDFGVAKQAPHANDSVTWDNVETSGMGASSFVGTPAYMAPEVLLEKEVDQRADIFSLGVICYEALGGCHPFRVGSPLPTIDRILHKEPLPLRQLNPKVSAELERVVAKMLAKDPADRYAAAADLLVDLRAAQRAAAYPAPPAVPPQTVAPQPAWATPWFWAAAALLILVITLLGLNVGRLRDRWWGAVNPGRIEAIAVLPLENLSGDPEQEYFADGMTDALITELSAVSALRVISRTSVMRYKGARKPLRQIARELNVDAVLEGAVLRSADRVRISAELIEASTERPLWAMKYERDLRDVLELQSEVALNITREISVKLTPQEQARLANTARVVKPEAYEAYLRGRYYWNKRTDEGFQEAIRYFQQAIEMDSMYAPAFAGLADAYAGRGAYHLLPPSEVMPKAKEAAMKALEMDDQLAEAHASLAHIKLYFLEFPSAEKELRRAIELNPHYATAHHWYALYLAAMARPDEAIAEINRARELDPLSLIINANLGWCYYLARQYDETILQSRKTLELDPGFSVAHEYLAQAYLEKRMYPEALAEFESAIALSAGSISYQAELGNAYAAAGQKDEAMKVLDKLTELAKTQYVSPYDLALVYVGLNKKEEAYRWLEKAYEERETRLMNLNVHPRFDSLRSEARFHKLLKRMGFREDSTRGSQTRTTIPPLWHRTAGTLDPAFSAL